MSEESDEPVGDAYPGESNVYDGNEYEADDKEVFNATLVAALET